MQRWKSCFLVAGAALLACSPRPPTARTAPPAPTRLPVAAVLWPDVARDAAVEKGGAHDAAVVVAVEQHPTLPALPGVRVSGEDWARFFATVLGVPPARVTTLFDAAATRSSISAAVRAGSARVAPGGRLWFVAVGHPVVDGADILAAVSRLEVQVVSVLDVAPVSAAAGVRPARSTLNRGGLASISFSSARAIQLPGAARPALSYFLMGALRGWGDWNHDGRVTSSEAAAYANVALRSLSPSGASEQLVSENTELVCPELTTLSVGREPAPNVTLSAPAAEPSSSADPEALFQALRGARALFERAEAEPDPTLAHCTWSEVARQYAASWWSNPEQFSRTEAALNGAYAYSSAGRTDEASALYRSYLNEQAGTRAGEPPADTQLRRNFAFAACASYLAIARAEPRHFPGYFDSCRSVDRKGIDRATKARAAEGARPPLAGPAAAAALELARELTRVARDREELAGWEVTESARTARLREASERYAVAERAWTTVIDLADALADRAGAARGLAEVAVRRLVVELEVGIEVTQESVESAQKQARRARDLSFDERRVEAARLLVELADALLASEQRAFAASQGTRGVAPRSEVRIEGERDARHPVRDDIPAPVALAIAARDEYLASVPASLDAGEARYRIAYEAGRLHFLFGHFAEARQRLQLPYAMGCGLQLAANDAWLLLISMATLELDVTSANALAADTAVCAFDVEQRIRSERIRKPVKSIPFIDALRMLAASEALPEGAERRALRREAAALCRQFLDEAPDRDEAPEAARRAAELYAELGEHRRALEMQRFFIDRYAAKARVRVADLERAYAALATLHARLGDYRALSHVLVEESLQKRLPASVTAVAARKARELRADRDGRGLEKTPGVAR